RVTTNDVIAAIRAQNAQVAAGQLGGLPAEPGTTLTATVVGPSRLTEPEQFRNILVRVNEDGSRLRLGDVATVTLDAENFVRNVRYNGRPATAMAVRLATGENALDTVNAINDTINRLKPFFPPGVEVVFPVDTAPFVRTSILEVAKTLGEAIVLVFLVMFLFLQNYRATLIPTIAVPVVLLGTFGVLAAFGYSINTLTMFGMALSIGLLVDDAIVVVENVERVMHEEGLSPKEATRKSMGQITGALVGIGLVLSAVFLPMAFFGGSTGVIFRQFSITIVSSMVLSVLVALILTPALCATILRPQREGHGAQKGFFGWFNRTFDRSVVHYGAGVEKCERNWGKTMLIYAVIIIGMGFLFLRLPSGFLPGEDQGRIINQVSLPAGATLEETEATMGKLRDFYLKDEKQNAWAVFSISGFGFGGQGQNVGIAFVKLRDWSERKGKEHSADAIAQRANAAFRKISAGKVIALVPPAVQELGNASGFDFQLKDVGGIGHEKLLEARNQLLSMAAADKRLVQVRPNGLEDTAQLKLNVDQAAAGALGMAQADVNDTISTALGSSYVNDFIDRNRVKRVYLQADAPFRTTPDSIGALHVRGASGTMAPLSAFSTTEWIHGPARLERFNGVPSMEIMGAPAPGVSSGEAMKAMEEYAAKLPPGVGYAWGGISYEEKTSGGQAPAL